jgi:hypothetical protein
MCNEKDVEHLRTESHLISATFNIMLYYATHLSKAGKVRIKTSPTSADYIFGNTGVTEVVLNLVPKDWPQLSELRRSAVPKGDCHFLCVCGGGAENLDY